MHYITNHEWEEGINGNGIISIETGEALIRIIIYHIIHAC